ncbi:hypothetical protein ACFPAF_16570 [Hymenobacter endophyticus]|uniref:Uncharacterized protein n=1 Tax=Hymenobacter endophyticus TaxID=3076335 RepID=A0ABU3TKX5_9BACT|nr:hypothetical protein [Hymenobacter endophyticus]MDU0372019.1 hypothetical protein [Hymenobacter endophyticus]
MPEVTTKRRGRPAAEAPAGRDLAAEQAHVAAWWAIRPGGKPSGRELARRINVSEGYIRHFMKQTRSANAHHIEQMQQMLGAYGYECPTTFHQFL